MQKLIFFISLNLLTFSAWSQGDTGSAFVNSCLQPTSVKKTAIDVMKVAESQKPEPVKTAKKSNSQTAPCAPNTGVASIYGVNGPKGKPGVDNLNGKRTASGKILDATKLTAAHRKLPFGTKVLIRNLKNGKEVVVTITDRGPFAAGRIIDVTKETAKELGFSGIEKVEISCIPKAG